MESFASIERETNQLEREHAELRDLQARLSGEIVNIREERRQLAERDTSKWHNRRFAVLVWASVLAVVVVSIFLVAVAQ